MHQNQHLSSGRVLVPGNLRLLVLMARAGSEDKALGVYKVELEQKF